MSQKEWIILKHPMVEPSSTMGCLRIFHCFWDPLCKYRYVCVCSKFRIHQEGAWWSLDALGSAAVDIVLPAQAAVVRRAGGLPLAGYQVCAGRTADSDPFIYEKLALCLQKSSGPVMGNCEIIYAERYWFIYLEW